MDMAINYVLSKSRAMKDKIESENIPFTFVDEHIRNSKHFNISYNSFLQKMVNKREINAEFKNVSKKTLEKLEAFFIDRIDRCMESQRVHQAYLDKSKYI